MATNEAPRGTGEGIMNSLEKLIADLDDSWDIIDDVKDYLAVTDCSDDQTAFSDRRLQFVLNAIQSAINRLKVLEEEIEVGE